MSESPQDVDVLLVGLGSTSGLRIADDELARSLQRAGARVERARAEPPRRDVPTLMLTDLLWARAARRAALQMLARVRPRAIIYSTTTAALLWPRPGAIRFDAAAAANRPGRHGLWQRPLERHRLRHAPLLLPWSEGALVEVGHRAAAPGSAGHIDLAGRALVLPAPIELEAAAAPDRDIAAITYAANPHKKGFDRVLAAWRQARSPGERLVVVGAARAALAAAGFALADDEQIDIVGSLTREETRALMRRARVFICAPRREDYGLVQLEALAEGCQLVTTPAPGPYVALSLARRLDARLVGADLVGALRAALATDRPARADYARRAAALIAPFGRAAADRLVADELLARLLPR
ncbi:MAG TPA: glycosyltransferase [Solirubrobacteraceae bacterium]|nr:glycosyltransferase [Solirubrobacteraceae bacterium]